MCGREEIFIMEEHRKLNDIYDFVESTLFENYLKLAKVNLLTGEYKFLKKDEALWDAGYENIPDIYSYIRKQAEDKQVYSEYAGDYLRYANPKYVQERVFSGEKRITQSYKRKIGDKDIWITFGIIVPESCSPENPWAVFCWRVADKDTIIMADALSTLAAIYYKILKINLTTDTFDEVKVDVKEQEEFASQTEKITEWWRKFMEAGNVQEEDREVYREFTDIEKLREAYRKLKIRRSCRYRRKVGNNYRWVQMELEPSIEYTDDNQVLLLYVKDIQEEYQREMRSRMKLVDSFHRDALTYLYNRHKFNEDLDELQKGGHAQFTCVYADVNGLHELNNHLGHQKGDDMLCCVADTLRKFFPKDRVYRIGGDEFVVLSKMFSQKSVERLMSEARICLMEDGYEISVGIKSGGQEDSVYKVISAAENAMREDKERYYKQNGGKRKKRDLNEKLEKMLTEKKDEEYFLKAIATKFAGVYLVDLKLDTPRHIYIPNYFSDILKKADFCFSDAMRVYVERYVKQEYQDEFYALLDYRILADRLREKASVEFSYQKTDGSWMDLRVMEIDNQTDEKLESIWIFTYKEK